MLLLLVRGLVQSCWMRRLKRFTAGRLLRPSLIAYSDEQGGHMFAVMASFLEGGTTTLRGDTVPSELNGRRVGVRI